MDAFFVEEARKREKIEADERLEEATRERVKIEVEAQLEKAAR
jgi:hypothetical protein